MRWESGADVMMRSLVPSSSEPYNAHFNKNSWLFVDQNDPPRSPPILSKAVCQFRTTRIGQSSNGLPGRQIRLLDRRRMFGPMHMVETLTCSDQVARVQHTDTPVSETFLLQGEPLFIRRTGRYSCARTQQTYRDAH
ncbi:hypothetical protein AG1IA_01777 [Rhizoctonia solani AG-1 IA]|uniref:Uncharacterized protein n=1 Tax=Thanatephorus cucumeris (strain AG1-IA) TaxID=983506 RepID=L8X1U0_THACA|nr:hypothetical protein AG1IA_01777 [Rhizoctonia solani AG-1 IA]